MPGLVRTQSNSSTALLPALATQLVLPLPLPPVQPPQVRHSPLVHWLFWVQKQGVVVVQVVVTAGDDDVLAHLPAPFVVTSPRGQL
jgi:hypothetical protein